MTNKIVAICAGHSDVDSGAVAQQNGKLVKEATLAVQFRNAVITYLQKEKNITLRVDGHGNNNAPLSESIKLIKGSDLAIEWHMNASTNATASGVETISLPKDKVLAQKLSGAIAKVFDSKLRGDKGWIDQSQSARGKLGFVSNKGLIVELEFISNPEKLKVFQEKYWLAARAVADVIIEHLNK